MSLIFLLLTSMWINAGELRPFESDGCTMAPEGTIRERNKWKECCVAHDLNLWGGGTKLERIQADQNLRTCMQAKAGTAIARIFWLAVKMGSLSPIKLPNKEWGNAWYKDSGYRSLSPDEIDQLILELEVIDIDQKIKDEYILELQNRV